MEGKEAKVVLTIDYGTKKNWCLHIGNSDWPL